jgi:hypothetical protein
VDISVKIEIADKYLPIFLRGRTIQVTKARLVLRTSTGQTVADNVEIMINNTSQKSFKNDQPQERNLWSHELSSEELKAVFAAGLFGEHTLVIKDAGNLAPAAPQPGDPAAIDSNKLLDLILYVEYQIKKEE